jgi:hypothetical protein
MVTSLRIKRLLPPADLLSCPDAPDPPAPDPGAALLRQSQVAEHLIAVWEAGEDCRAKLRAIQAWAADASGSPSP